MRRIENLVLFMPLVCSLISLILSCELTASQGLTMIRPLNKSFLNAQTAKSGATIKMVKVLAQKSHPKPKAERIS